jgi:hypothetical protein
MNGVLMGLKGAVIWRGEPFVRTRHGGNRYASVLAPQKSKHSPQIEAILATPCPVAVRCMTTNQQGCV